MENEEGRSPTGPTGEEMEEVFEELGVELVDETAIPDEDDERRELVYLRDTEEGGDANICLDSDGSSGGSETNLDDAHVAQHDP